MSVNHVFLVGYLGQDPILHLTANGKTVGRFSLATNARWYDAEGKEREHTEWHQVVVWNRIAENCHQFLSVGSQVFIEGALHTRRYEDKDGQQRIATEIVAQRVVFLRNGKGHGEPDSEQGSMDDTGGFCPSRHIGIFQRRSPKVTVSVVRVSIRCFNAFEAI